MQNEPKNEKIKPGNRVEKITKRDLVFVEHLLAGKSAASSARLAGFTEAGSNKACDWIRQTREQSRKPLLFDYWRKRSDANFRILGVTAENILRELAIIGFSSIDKFIDFPSKADAAEAFEHDAKHTPKSKSAFGTLSALSEIESEDDEDDSKTWKKFRPGSVIKLKCLEDIPADLMPAIAEINETKEGIRIKLHPKLPALQLLAQIMKMVGPIQEKQEDQVDYQINISVNGSKSPLLNSPTPEK